MRLQHEFVDGIDEMNKVSEDRLITDLEMNDIECEINIDEGNVDIKSVEIPEYIRQIVASAKEISDGQDNEKMRYKVICGKEPYNKNAVTDNDLYQNGIAFIVDPTSLTVPCSLLRIYSLFFQSTDKAVALIAALVEQKVSHEQFAKYLFCVHGIKLINCFSSRGAKKTDLRKKDFNRVDEVLCVGQDAYNELVKENIVPADVKTGQIIHSSALVYNASEYFKTWHLYQDSCIKNNKGIKLIDFKIF